MVFFEGNWGQKRRGKGCWGIGGKKNRRKTSPTKHKNNTEQKRGRNLSSSGEKREAKVIGDQY